MIIKTGDGKVEEVLNKDSDDSKLAVAAWKDIKEESEGKAKPKDKTEKPSAN